MATQNIFKARAIFRIKYSVPKKLYLIKYNKMYIFLRELIKYKLKMIAIFVVKINLFTLIKYNNKFG